MFLVLASFPSLPLFKPLSLASLRLFNIATLAFSIFSSTISFTPSIYKFHYFISYGIKK
ncbi:hypothetical protein MBAV_003467 [Candidatus Magnetobacterium bavaricum]|uniref:Uncharacterized protein n=1 Tax=Candidatus Magnetobacterium bavaricum TaxID=29290 RepID=A0A0F3GQZ8_9BACT|nr:hypothetical protein MBAV_003467 [Candidatus Magnetobacterium bavaricum]